MLKSRTFIIAFVTISVVLSVLVYFENQQADYVYLNGQYYALTSEPLDVCGGLRGEAIGTVTQNAGDSNALPVGAKVCAIRTEGLPYDDQLHYSHALTYYSNGEYRIARHFLRHGDLSFK